MKKDNSESTKKNTENGGKSKETENPWAGVVVIGSSLDSPEELEKKLREFINKRYSANQKKK